MHYILQKIIIPAILVTAGNISSQVKYLWLIARLKKSQYINTEQNDNHKTSCNYFTVLKSIKLYATSSCFCFF